MGMTMIREMTDEREYCSSYNKDMGLKYNGVNGNKNLINGKILCNYCFRGH